MTVRREVGEKSLEVALCSAIKLRLHSIRSGNSCPSAFTGPL